MTPLIQYNRKKQAQIDNEHRIVPINNNTSLDLPDVPLPNVSPLDVHYTP